MHEVNQPCAGLWIEPPPKEKGTKSLFRVVYQTDVSGTDALDAARQAYRIMTDPVAWPPVLEVLDDRGQLVEVDLADARNS